MVAICAVYSDALLMDCHAHGESSARWLSACGIEKIKSTAIALYTVYRAILCQRDTLSRVPFTTTIVVVLRGSFLVWAKPIAALV